MKNNDSLQYKMLPVAVSTGFRSLVLLEYPILGSHPDAAVYWRIMQYVLFSTHREEETGRLIVPYRHIAAIVGIHPHRKGFNAGAWLQAFSEDVLRLDVADPMYLDGEARTIVPKVTPGILTALMEERTDGERVWFESGLPVSRRGLKAVRDEYSGHLRSLSLEVPENHPAYPLVEYLLLQPQGMLRRVLARNWPRVEEAINALPQATPRQQATRLWSQRVLTNLMIFNDIYYVASPKTQRLFAAGATVHQLPRVVRRIAFAGQVECDLRACQLAVVARLWDIPPLQRFLESGASIWAELLAHTGMPMTYKGIIKRTIYSIVFGMARRKLWRQLAEGDLRDEGIGQDAARKFASHPLITALLMARGRQMRLVGARGGCEDAWGKWVAATWNPDKQRMDLPSVLACAVQSYELRLMLSILPILKAEPQIHLLSWLHDGVTLHMGNHTKQDRQNRKLTDAVDQEARFLGMATCLEVEVLPS